jgi:alanine racemase
MPEPSGAEITVPPSALRLRLDHAALAANWRALDAMSAGQVRTGAAVKADGYGLGAANVVPTLHAAGCRDWFVAHWSEVAALRPLVPAAAIAVLHGPMTAADTAYARASGVRPVLNSLAQIARWLEAGGGPCDVMVDTGINRLGLAMADLGDPMIARLDIDCCHSHLACADVDSPLNAAQLARFGEVRTHIAAQRYALANSAGIALGAGFHADLTRPGLALYGGIARAELVGHIAQVAWPEAAAIQVRTLTAGDTVGYNATFTATAAMRIGVVALGYADGYLRCWSGKGAFEWRGQRLPVLGRVSMDMTVVDLTQAPDVREGDWLPLDYDLSRAAATSGLSQYELLTLLGQRFARE